MIEYIMQSIWEIIHIFGRHPWQDGEFDSGGFHYWFRYCPVCGEIEIQCRTGEYRNINEPWRFPTEEKRFIDGLANWHSPDYYREKK